MAITEAGFSQELGKRGFELKSYSQSDDGSFEVQASKLYSVLVNGQDLFVPVPVTLSVTLDKDDHVLSVKSNEADLQSVTSAEQFVKTLADNNQIDGLSGQSLPNATHKIEVNSQGQKVVKRQGYSLG
jgi:hypothetical protein